MTSLISYKHILKISLPIMVGSAVQNGIAVSDSLFLYYYDETDFAAIGIVSVFYLIISAIGYGFSKGGQIIIARRAGQGDKSLINRSFSNMVLFQLLIALLLFMFLYFLSRPFLSLFIDNPLILNKCVEYLNWRSWSIFFSYTGLAFIALYTGLSRTTFIMFDVGFMLLVNVLLNYGLIFGGFGLPEMGIKGAALASAIAETAAFFLFLAYVFYDKKLRYLRLSFRKIYDKAAFQQIVRIGSPVVGQSIIGLGSWFVFFAFVEGMGERALAVTNLGRIIYLFFSIPCWGFASGLNTLTSFLMGQDRMEEVMPVIRKTAILCLSITMAIAIPLLISPSHTLSFFKTGDQFDILLESANVLRMLIPILFLFCVGAIYFNGLIGTGDAVSGLYIQLIGVILYIGYLYVVVSMFQLDLIYAWTGELFYWMSVITMTGLYLRGNRWKSFKF